jgi:hypothetical protein
MRVVFDGPAIHDGSMDVRDLAPALLAIGRLCEEANRVLLGEEVKIAVNVRADFHKGSFDVGLEVIQSLYNQMLALFGSDTASAAMNLLGFIGFSSGCGSGLIKLIKWLRGRRPTRVITLEDGNVKIEFDGQSMIVSSEVLKLYTDLNVRKAAQATTRPLEREGIEEIRFQVGGNDMEKIKKKDVVSFVVPDPDDEKIVDEERTIAYTVISPTFKEDNKWRLHDGQNTINATMDDVDFLARIDSKDVSFAKDDMLVCRVRVEQIRTKAGGLRSEYTIIRVLEHHTAARQIPLPFNE